MKAFFLFSLLFCFLNADYKIIENKNLFLVEVTNSSFEKDLVDLKDEISYEGFTIVYELNLAKATNELATFLKEKGVLKKGINLGICKSSFTLQMVKENFNNINYCPLAISIYKKDKNKTYISYKFYKTFKDNDKIANKINETLKKLILDSLE
ncbi:conserved hypothetical protein [Arcobacter nitrofigilis DSM 7299]|uniref:DUF302 domain-containing protein n=1 Tax=Arcobacter nitrofigilis (strain ATCC 33309 / DSM 7299 / CCUG 15893 / LMG 7604 / NCTC 12251 / CI) TaxID=572480 RepID=D5V718_ARCNC|nr:hypothetical protein [Arcobacter nitrofigilis]ADG94438.1 conserved hypothetical protein [Arcobacter nitrofigilis DSM 7299]